jgi:NAD(P)H-flavin reductase
VWYAIAAVVFGAKPMSEKVSRMAVLSEPRPEDRWEGRVGLVHEAILADFPDLARHQVYACGSAGMVQAAHPAFMARGLSEHDCFSDAFRLAPRVTTKSADMVRLRGTA